uniref:Protein ALP1-like n=1 Tax=Tanacetum cinerariifolium TaxID=118510 RepID=A0A6L2KF61_TANCI|nr:hypothetical protein [Tanacetum cinerariifolium]
MNQNNEDRQLFVFEIDANDDETDVVFLEQAVRLDATGRMSLSVIMKCTAAIRQLAYGTTPDAFDEYLQMSERTARDSLTNFNKCIIYLYMSEYLRKPTLEDVENVYNKHLTAHGFSGMLGSIDCANNDINVLDNSPLFDDLLNDTAPVLPYVVNSVGYEKGCYLADGIYPQWATFVKSFTVVNDAKHAYFKKRQEGARKDVERAFGVLQEHQKMAVFDLNEVYADATRNMQRTWIERCETQRRKNKEIRDRDTHVSLQQNLMEHILQEVEHEEEDF